MGAVVAVGVATIATLAYCAVGATAVFVAWSAAVSHMKHDGTSFLQTLKLCRNAILLFTVFICMSIENSSPRVWLNAGLLAAFACAIPIVAKLHIAFLHKPRRWL
jgi:hypothetical protein